MKVVWTNLPDGLKLVITTANDAAYPKIIGTPEALDRWMPRLVEMAEGNPSSIAVDATGVTFSSLSALPNQMQMLTLFGNESGTIEVELSEILVDAGAVRWALANRWVDAENASILLEAFEPAVEAQPEPVSTAAQAALELEVEPEAAPTTTDDNSVNRPAAAIADDDERYDWIDFSAYAMRLVLSETSPSYQAQGGAAMLPSIEGSPAVLRNFKPQLEALGMTFIDTEDRTTAFYMGVDEIPTVETIKVHFPMVDVTEVGRYDLERPFGVPSQQSDLSIDFTEIDFAPVQEVMAKGLVSRARRIANNAGEGLIPLTEDELIAVASRYTGVAPEMFKREITNYSLRQLQETLEAAAVSAARELSNNAVVDGKHDQALAEKLIEALVSDLPNMDVRSGESQELMQYSTPLHMGLLVQQTLGITPDDQRSVWEPTMGNGALLTMVAPENISGIELDPKRVARLQSQGIKAVQGNAIDTAASEPRSKDIVVMNPPFGALPKEFKNGSKGLTYYSSLDANARIDISRQDHWIALAHLEAMKDDGKAFIILGADSPMKHAPGEISSKSNRFRQMIHDNYKVVGESWVSGNVYKQQGAAWPLHVIAIGGRRDVLADARFEEQLPTVHSMDELRDLLDQWSVSMRDIDLSIPGMPEQSEKSTRTPGQSDPKDSQKQVDPLTGMALPEEDPSKETSFGFAAESPSPCLLTHLWSSVGAMQPAYREPLRFFSEAYLWEIGRTDHSDTHPSSCESMSRVGSDVLPVNQGW